MDFIGPIDPPSWQKTYIIVCTDYLTKAVKVERKEKVADLLWENVFYEFGYLRDLITYHGTQFTSHMIENLLIHHKIKHMKSTPYHPQAYWWMNLYVFTHIFTLFLVSILRHCWSIYILNHIGIPFAISLWIINQWSIVIGYCCLSGLLIQFFL